MPDARAFNPESAKRAAMSAPAASTGPSPGCIVMASGMGTRFGGNKLMAELGGKPLVCHVLKATEGLFARRVVVTRSPEVARVSHAAGAEVVLHDKPLRSDAVGLGMDVIGACSSATFVQADQPLICPRSIVALLRGAEEDPAAIWRASFDGMPGAPVLFPAWAFEELRALPPGKGGGFVARTHPKRVRCVQVSSAWELFDVDTQDDLQVLREHLAVG